MLDDLDGERSYFSVADDDLPKSPEERLHRDQSVREFSKMLRQEGLPMGVDLPWVLGACEWNVSLAVQAINLALECRCDEYDAADALRTHNWSKILAEESLKLNGLIDSHQWQY